MISVAAHGSKSGQRRRKAVNAIMLTAAGLMTMIVIAPLIWILAYVVQAGLPALNVSFFTQLPTPVGVPGGGLANALVGSLITVGLGALIAAPIGVLAGVYAATHPNTPFGLSIRFGTDVISGVPSIV
ncbi:MAG TPA: hypothetical protein VLE49_08085, partial [Anaerolineales bacterium]|nr:hypothetical protein [Anaerolineales bacterium]